MSSELRTTWVGAALVATLLAMAPACTAVLGYEPLAFTEGSDGGGAGGRCASRAGPIMVAVEGFCIDATEVTNAEYTPFLAAVRGALPGLPAACSWKMGHTPEQWPHATFAGNQPVRFVDWCDAWAFCAWGGKKLCGRVEGGALPVASLGDPGADAWYRACSRGGTRAYAYGDSYEKGRCNGESVRSEPAAAGSFPECLGGYPGLFDMSGNVREWVDTCEASAGKLDSCTTRSSEWDRVAPVEYACAYASPRPRDYRSTSVGFRCCADPG